MIIFNVPDMSCGHCVAAITKAVAQAAPDATVNCDLATHEVRIENAETQAVKQAIEQAGYAVTVKS